MSGCVRQTRWAAQGRRGSACEAVTSSFHLDVTVHPDRLRYQQERFGPHKMSHTHAASRTGRASILQVVKIISGIWRPGSSCLSTALGAGGFPGSLGAGA